MPRRTRTYNTRLIKATWPYSVQEVAALFGLHKNAVLRWLKEGLQPIEWRKPYLIRGNVLKAFLKERQKSRKRSCAPHEFYCVKCRAPREAYLGEAEAVFERPKVIRIRAACEVCRTPLNKIQATKKWPEILKTFPIKKLVGPHISGCLVPNLNSDLEKPHEAAANQPKE